MSFLNDINIFLHETFAQNRVAKAKVIFVFLVIGFTVMLMGGFVGIILLTVYSSPWWLFVIIPWVALLVLWGNFINWYDANRVREPRR